jgi:hypothetical protein
MRTLGTTTVADLVLMAGWTQPLSSGAKRLTLIRHAEGLHNRDYRDLPNYVADGLGHTMKYWDARLTEEGVEQAKRLSSTTYDRAKQGLPQVVVVSPMTRALETAAHAWPNRSSAPRPPMVATSLARERVGNHTCDGRRNRSELAAEFPWVDFSQVPSEEDEMWAFKEGIHLIDGLERVSCQPLMLPSTHTPVRPICVEQTLRTANSLQR